MFGVTTQPSSLLPGCLLQKLLDVLLLSAALPSVFVAVSPAGAGTTPRATKVSLPGGEWRPSGPFTLGPDGAVLIFQARRNGGNEEGALLLYDPEKGDVKVLYKLRPRESVSSLSVSGDGSAVLISVDRPREMRVRRTELLIDLSSGERRRVDRYDARFNMWPHTQLTADGRFGLFSKERSAGAAALFRYDVSERSLEKILDLERGQKVAAISGDGLVVALTGGGTRANAGLLLRSLRTGKSSRLCASRCDGPVLDVTGTLTVFSSGADISGENPDRNQELFLYNAEHQTIAQLTRSTTEMTMREGRPVGAFMGSRAPSLSADGRRIAFVSDADFTGENPDHSVEAFLLDKATCTYYQLSSFTGRRSAGRPQVSADGTHVAFDVMAGIEGSGGVEPGLYSASIALAGLGEEQTSQRDCFTAKLLTEVFRRAAELASSERATLARLALQWVEEGAGFPDWNLVKDRKTIIVSAENLPTGMSFDLRSHKVKVMGREEIQRVANSEGDFLYFIFGKFDVSEKSAVVSLSLVWAVSGKSRKEGRMYLSGGGMEVPFVKERGKWRVRRTGLMQMWISLRPVGSDDRAMRHSILA